MTAVHRFVSFKLLKMALPLVGSATSRDLLISLISRWVGGNYTSSVRLTFTHSLKCQVPLLKYHEVMSLEPGRASYSPVARNAVVIGNPSTLSRLLELPNVNFEF